MQDVAPGGGGIGRSLRRQRSVGSFVMIVGPDGSGKSTLARKLIEERGSGFTKVVHMHWRPGLLPRAGSLVGVKAGDPTKPHAHEPHGAVLSHALLAYDWLDFFLGMWLRIVPIRARGGLVVMERGWFDIAVDPRRYHLAVSQRLVELLGRLLPSPNLVLVLEAEPRVLSNRKAELPLAELTRQMGRWREITFPRSTVRLRVDASQSQEQLVRQVTRALLLR